MEISWGYRDVEQIVVVFRDTVETCVVSGPFVN